MKPNGYRSNRLLEKPIIIHTAGKNGLRVLRKLRALGIEPVAFADASPKKIGKKISGIRVEPIESIVNKYGNNAKYVAASTLYWSEINAKLRELGIVEENILTERIEEYAISGGILRPVVLDDVARTKLQTILLELMIFFHKVCEKYNILYYLYGGTLLGAVRHNGFIPWDDDVDFCMFRKDYDRFFSVVEAEIGNRYIISSIYDENGPYKTNKIGLIGTKMRMWDGKNPVEILIDIMPMDNVKKPEGFMIKLQDVLQRKLLVVAKSGDFSNLFCRFLHKFTSRKAIVTVLNWIVRINNKKQTSFVYYFCGEKGFREARTFKREWFAERIMMDFEGNKFWVPKEYDKILTAMYGGDYMQLPPVNMRAIHPRAELNFGTN
jgi:lipopolysaccharide cholinephosphotransferase